MATNTATWSDELYRIWGVSLQTFGKTYEDVVQLIHPHDRETFNTLIQRASQTHEPYIFEHRIIRPDGTMRILQSRGTVIVDEAGHVVRMLGTGQDITERKQAENERERLLAELDESRRLFQRMADASPDALYVYDFHTGRPLYISKRSEQVIGHTAEKMTTLGDRFAVTHWHPDDVPDLPEHRRRLRGLADGEIYECEYRMLHSDGTYHWLRTRSTVFARDADGQVRQIVGITQDVTERKQAEEQLAYHALLLENLHDAIVAADDRLVVTAWNWAAEAMYGWTAEEVLGRDIREVVRSEYDPGKRA